MLVDLYYNDLYGLEKTSKKFKNQMLYDPIDILDEIYESSKFNNIVT